MLYETSDKMCAGFAIEDKYISKKSGDTTTTFCFTVRFKVP